MCLELKIIYIYKKKGQAKRDLSLKVPRDRETGRETERETMEHTRRTESEEREKRRQIKPDKK